MEAPGADGRAGNPRALTTAPTSGAQVLDIVRPRVATTTTQIDLGEQGIAFDGALHRNTTTSVLYEHAVLRREARIAEGGPFVVDTGVHTGRSPAATGCRG